MKKFKLPAVPQSTSKSIRFPNEVIEQVEQAIRGTEVTFSAFVIEATRVALENLREEREGADSIRPFASYSGLSASSPARLREKYARMASCSPVWPSTHMSLVTADSVVMS